MIRPCAKPCRLPPPPQTRPQHSWLQSMKCRCRPRCSGAIAAPWPAVGCPSGGTPPPSATALPPTICASASGWRPARRYGASASCWSVEPARSSTQSLAGQLNHGYAVFETPRLTRNPSDPMRSSDRDLNRSPGSGAGPPGAAGAGSAPGCRDHRRDRCRRSRWCAPHRAHSSPGRHAAAGPADG